MRVGAGCDSNPNPSPTPGGTTTTRVITYGYDGVQRLIGAIENPGVSYAYTYDLAGNRTDGGKTYNAANQISNAGYTYDNAGNLTNDGTATYSYDALSRMTARGTTSYSYNGDGVLVYDGTTRSTQDLAAPLSQVLQTTQGSATTQYLYGLDRLAAVAGSTRTWYGADALGSVRQTLNDTGAPLGIVNYDPWGTPESGTVPTFGFTGEIQDPAAGLVNLRARWYSTNQGKFTSVDPFAGDPETPYSLHPYAYGLSDPVLNTDPSGRIVPGVCPIGYIWDNDQQSCVDNPNFPSWLSFLKGQLPLLPGPGGVVQSGGEVAVEVGDKVVVEPLKNFAVEVSAEACKSTLPIWARVTALILTGVSAVGGALAPAVPPANQPAGGYVTVYRFADRNDRESLRPNLSRLPLDVQVRVRSRFARSPRSLYDVMYVHSSVGAPDNSPFVSVLTDHARAAQTSDPCLQTIIWGQPGATLPNGKECKRAPDLGKFRVPSERLFDPGTELSTEETELLFLGDDLGSFREEWRENPYYGPRPPRRRN